VNSLAVSLALYLFGSETFSSSSPLNHSFGASELSSGRHLAKPIHIPCIFQKKPAPVSWPLSTLALWGGATMVRYASPVYARSSSSLASGRTCLVLGCFPLFSGGLRPDVSICLRKRPLLFARWSWHRGKLPAIVSLTGVVGRELVGGTCCWPIIGVRVGAVDIINGCCSPCSRLWVFGRGDSAIFL